MRQMPISPTEKNSADKSAYDNRTKWPFLLFIATIKHELLLLNVTASQSRPINEPVRMLTFEKRRASTGKIGRQLSRSRLRMRFFARKYAACVSIFAGVFSMFNLRFNVCSRRHTSSVNMS